MFKQPRSDIPLEYAPEHNTPDGRFTQGRALKHTLLRSLTFYCMHRCSDDDGGPASFLKITLPSDRSKKGDFS